MLTEKEIDQLNMQLAEFLSFGNYDKLFGKSFPSSHITKVDRNRVTITPIYPEYVDLLHDDLLELGLLDITRNGDSIILRTKELKDCLDYATALGDLIKKRLTRSLGLTSYFEICRQLPDSLGMQENNEIYEPIINWKSQKTTIRLHCPDNNDQSPTFNILREFSIASGIEIKDINLQVYYRDISLLIIEVDSDKLLHNLDINADAVSFINHNGKSGPHKEK